MAQTTNYKFGSNDLPISSQKRGHRRVNSKSSTGSEKDDQSLTYSASSSVQSTSTTGESTDSSFAEIYKVLDSAEEEGKIQEILGGSPNAKETRQGTINTGQSSDSHGHDGGGHGSALFVPADSNRSTPSRPSSTKNKNSSKKQTATSSSSGTTTAASNNKKGKQAEKTRPPQGPIKKNDGKQIWYSQLWMCGFADAFNLSGDTQN